MTAIAAGEGGFQETLVRVGHAVQVIEQGRQDFVQILLRILGHRHPILGAVGIEALGLERRQADRFDATTRLGHAAALAGEWGQDQAQGQRLPRGRLGRRQGRLRG